MNRAFIEAIATHTVRAVSEQRVVKNVMTPMLWACGVVSTPCMIMASFAQSPLSYLIFALGAFPVIITCGFYAFFAFTDPKRLQTEGFNLKDRALGMIETKSGKFTVNPLELQDIVNPYREPELLENKIDAEHTEDKGAQGDVNV